jgi:hypothetical protein
MLRRTTTLLVMVLAFGAIAAVALSAPSGIEWKSFGHAHWSPDGNGSRFGLTTTSTPTGEFTATFGGIELLDPPSNPAAITDLSFDFNPNRTGSSGGSPRLVVVFSNGGNAGLRPLTWNAGTWTTLDGLSGSNWDNNSGGCGFRYAVTWTDVVACHPGETIASIFVVNDSGWLYQDGGEQIVLDNVTVNDAVATGPGVNS